MFLKRYKSREFLIRRTRADKISAELQAGYLRYGELQAGYLRYGELQAGFLRYDDIMIQDEGY